MNGIKLKSTVLLTILGVSLSSCSSLKTTVDNRDPFENYNRKIFKFNDKVYDALTPAARLYNKVMPETLKSGIFNIYQNLHEPARIVNDALQGEWGYAGDDSIRLLTNSTLGILGFFDVADSWFNKPLRYYQSFAVTLHKWGVYKDNEASPYIVWPFAGPGTLEDLASGVDVLFNPLTYVFIFVPISPAITISVSAGTTGSYVINQGATYLPKYQNFKEVSIDPYIAVRNAYLQNYDYGVAKVLKKQVGNGNANNTNDQEVLGVLGLDGNNSGSQKATADDNSIKSSKG